MQQKADRLLVGGFLTTLLVMSLTFVFWPVQSFSPLENRYLQGVPKLTWDRLISHQFAEEAESFISDQFPYRKQWIALKSSIEQLRLQQEHHGIFKGKEHYLLEHFKAPDAVKLQRYVEAVKRWGELHSEVKTTFFLAPNSVGMYPERLPWLASVYPQKDVHEQIATMLQHGKVSYIDGLEVLQPHADEALFYRNDHHWTTYGAYLAYASYAKQMGWTPLTPDQFEIKKVSESFLGSYHTRGQFNNVIPDTIEQYIPKRQHSTEVYIADTGETHSSMYDPHYLTTKDQYSFFLGGVHALMKLTTQLEPKAVDQDKLLVIKDSYAHSLIPFLTEHVSEIHVLDIRYYNGSLEQYVKDHEIREVLLLFNTSTFVENEAIMKLGHEQKASI